MPVDLSTDSIATTQSNYHFMVIYMQDRRKELTKKVSKMGEDGKVAVRNVRKDILKRLDKYDFPKDAKKGLEDSIQKLTDGFVKKLEDMVKAKSEDIMKV